MTLTRRFYLDPLEHMLAAEAESCKGCEHRTLLPRLKAPICMDPAHSGGPHSAEKRCDNYKERG